MERDSLPHGPMPSVSGYNKFVPACCLLFPWALQVGLSDFCGGPAVAVSWSRKAPRVKFVVKGEGVSG